MCKGIEDEEAFLWKVILLIKYQATQIYVIRSELYEVNTKIDTMNIPNVTLGDYLYKHNNKYLRFLQSKKLLDNFFQMISLI